MKWGGGIPSSFYQIMIVFKQAGDYFMGYSCFLSITYWWTWTNGRFNQRLFYFRIISAFTSDRGCPASITYLMAFIKVRNISEVVLSLSHYFAFQQEEFEDTKGIIRIRKLKVRQHNGQKKKDEKDKHTHKTKDRETRASLKSGGELMCTGRISSPCSTSDTRRVILVTNPVVNCEWGKNREVLTTSGTYPWSFVTQIFHNGQPSHGGARNTSFRGCFTSITKWWPLTNLKPNQRSPFYHIITALNKCQRLSYFCHISDGLHQVGEHIKCCQHTTTYLLQ